MKNRALLFLVCLAAFLAARPVHAGDDTHGDELPPGAVARLGTTRMRHPHSSRVIFSPDSKYAATISDVIGNTGVRVWEATTGKRWLPAFTDKLSQEQWTGGTIIFSEDGKSLRFVDPGGSVRMLDLQTGEVRGTEQRVVAPGVYPLGYRSTVSRNGRYLVFERQQRLVVYDLAKNEEVTQIGPLEDSPASISVSFDASIIVTRDSREKTVQVWSGKTGQPIWQHQADVGNWSPGLSRDGKLITIPLQDSGFAVFEPFTGKKILHGKTQVCASSFSPDQRRLATISPFGHVHVWEVASGEQVVATEVPSAFTFSIEHSPDGKTLAVVASDGVVWLLDAASGRSLIPEAVHVEEVKRVAMSADGKRVLSAGDGTMILWNVEEQTNTLVEHLFGASVAMSPDGKRFATKEPSGMLSFYSNDSGEPTWQGHTNNHTLAIEYSPDSRYLAVPALGGSDALRVIDFSNDSVAIAKLTDDAPISCAWFADGKRLAGGTSRGTVRIWRTPNMRELAVLEDRKTSGAVVDLAVHPSGKFLAALVATSGTAGSPRLWNIDARKPLGAHRFQGILDSRQLTKIRFSPDGSILAGVANDRTLRLWSWKTGKLLTVIGAQQDGVSDFAFSGDGSRMVTAGRDSTLLVWDLAALLAQHR